MLGTIEDNEELWDSFIHDIQCCRGVHYEASKVYEWRYFEGDVEDIEEVRAARLSRRSKTFLRRDKESYVICIANYVESCFKTLAFQALKKAPLHFLLSDKYYTNG